MTKDELYEEMRIDAYNAHREEEEEARLGYSHEEYIAKWRLPTIQELLSLVDYTKHSPASSEDTISNYYWSSTTDANYTDYAWYLDFYYGDQYYYNKTNSNYVRCVRDTSNGLEWSKDAPTGMPWHEAMEYAESLNN